MKKKIVIVISVVLAALLLAFIVLQVSFRKITVISGKDLVDGCPRFARPGHEVTVTTAVVSDGEIYVSGVNGDYAEPGVYVFIMPDQDVQLSVYVIANPNGA